MSFLIARIRYKYDSNQELYDVFCVCGNDDDDGNNENDDNDDTVPTMTHGGTQALIQHQPASK